MFAGLIIPERDGVLVAEGHVSAPDPVVYTTGLSDNSVVNQGGSVKLITTNGVASKVISISSLGQVTF